jgi:transposase
MSPPGAAVKSARERMQIVSAYQELGSYRAAAKACGTTPKTVRRVMERQRAGGLAPPRKERGKNTDAVAGLVTERVVATDGRISAKRLLPLARAAGYEGSARNLRRLVADAKARHRRERRVYRPWVPVPGGHLVIDWTPAAGLQMFGAVLAWCRYRFVRFAPDQRRATTLRLLGECLEEIGGVPGVVLSDRMAGLRANEVAGLVVPHPDYVRFCAHYGTRPDFCWAADPESKGMVEHLMGYAQRDLVVPAGEFADAEQANAAARVWCEEVNGRPHTEICAIPAERLVIEAEHLRPLPELRPAIMAGVARKVDRLSCVRLGSARYSVPHALVGHQVLVAPEEGQIVIRHQGHEVARHTLVAPGGVAIVDEHYGGPRPGPARSPRPRTSAERAFCALGPEAECFLVAAAAAGTARLPSEIAEILGLEAAFGRELVVGAIDRAHRFHRYGAGDVRAILAAGAGVADVVPAGAPLTLALPSTSARPLSAYAPGRRP